MSNLAEPKLGLKTFCPSSCHFYGHHHIEEIGKISCFVVHELLLQFFTNLSLDLEEYITAIRGVT